MRFEHKTFHIKKMTDGRWGIRNVNSNAARPQRTFPSMEMAIEYVDSMYNSCPKTIMIERLPEPALL